MARASNPTALVPVRNRSGTLSYRVTATIRGKQRKKSFSDLARAQSLQQRWEQLRQEGEKRRPKRTHLSAAQIREAEAAFELIKNENVGIVDAAKQLLIQKTKRPPEVTFADALQQFLFEKEVLSTAQHESYRIRGENFRDYIGATTLLSKVQTSDIYRWLRSKGSTTAPLGKKTWNNYRNDLSAIFAWFMKKPRRWISENPIEGIVKFPKRSLRPRATRRLEPEVCQELMSYLEEEKPEWCTFFTLTLFLGVRPDMRSGEIWKLAQCVARDGAALYFQNGYLHLSAEITKEGTARLTTIPANVGAWLDLYPPTPTRICPGSYSEYRKIRAGFGIPPDGMRHTAISAHVARHGSLANAAMEFGCSESVIRTHYFARMGPGAAERFYMIVPMTRGLVSHERRSRGKHIPEIGMA